MFLLTRLKIAPKCLGGTHMGMAGSCAFGVYNRLNPIRK